MPRSACVPLSASRPALSAPARAGMLASGLILALFPDVARADLTADQVWQNWLDLSAASGQTLVPGAMERDGADLILTDVAISVVSPEARTTGVIPRIVMQEREDGTVSTTMTDRYSMQVELTPANGKRITTTLDIDQSGATLVASGDPQALTYEFLVEVLDIAGRDLVIDGEPDATVWAISVADLRQDYAVTPGNPMRLDTTSTAASADLTLRIPETPDEGGPYSLNLRLTDIGGTADMMLPVMADAQNATASDFTAAGGRVSFAMEHQGGTLDLSGVDPEGRPSEVAVETQSGHARTALDAERMAYDLGMGETAIRIEGVRSEALAGGEPMPPIAVTLQGAGLAFDLPVPASDEAQDFSLGLRLEGLAPPEEIWGMIDPEESLPREPATVVLDLGGQMRMLAGLLDPEAVAAVEGSPIELEQLDIREMRLGVAGAELTANGALEFDNSQPPMLGGVAPVPQGSLALSLTGATALMGKLMELGLLDPSVAIGFGMATAMYARPGEGEDSFVTEIESRPDGIFANGVPLPLGP